MAKVIWLEPIAGRDEARDEAAVFKPIAPSDPRLKEYERCIDTEAGRFARRLAYRATERYGVDPAFREPVLPIVVRKQGNNAAYGFSIETPRGVEQHPKLPYLILDPSPRFLGDTILHETGHLVHAMAVGGRRGGAAWSPFPHTTFAVSDPITALAEGYGIHLETIWGHFGSDPAKRAYYHRLSPAFEGGRGYEEEYFSPVEDLLNFAQVWARYQAVRDGTAAFEGHVYPAYARSQMDPSRDRSRLKTANAMLASEGVAASVMFWVSCGLAQQAGAKPGGGLDQPALVDAEMTLLDAMAALPEPVEGPRPDILDFVQALARRDAATRDMAISRFVDVTRGVTAQPGIRAKWRALYDNSILLNRTEAFAQIKELDTERSAIVDAARQDVRSLRAGVGAVLPVRVNDATFELKALGGARPIEFDLNAMSAADLALLARTNPEATPRIERERDRAPFASLADFTSRTGLSLAQIGVTAVDMSK